MTAKEFIDLHKTKILKQQLINLETLIGIGCDFELSALSCERGQARDYYIATFTYLDRGCNHNDKLEYIIKFPK